MKSWRACRLGFFCLFSISQVSVWGGDAPTALPDSFTTKENKPVFIDPFANDFDPDGDALAVAVVENPSCAGAQLINNYDGSFIFVPPADFIGICTFTYSLDDGSGAPPAQAIVTLNVVEELGLTLPVIVQQPQVAVAAMGQSAIFSVAADADGADMTFQWQFNGADIHTGSAYSIENTQNTSQLTVYGMQPELIGFYRCLVSVEEVAVSDSAALLLGTIGIAKSAFAGATPVLPATLEAENYDFGNPGVSHADQTAGNQGGVYRTGDSDIFSASGGYFVSGIESGEWMDYEVEVQSLGVYDLQLTVAGDPSLNTEGIRFSLDVDGASRFCAKTFPATNGAEDWQTVIVPGLLLTMGVHSLRLRAESDHWNFDQISLTASTGQQAPFTSNGLPHPAGHIEIENYDSGGPGVAYSDNGMENSGNFCDREPDGVDLDQIQGSQVVLTDIEANEWLEYTVQIPNSGNFDLKFNYKNHPEQIGQDGALVFKIASDGITIQVPLPSSGDFSTLTVPGITLNEGQKVVQLLFSNPTYILDFMEIEAGMPAPPVRVTYQGSDLEQGETVPLGTTETDNPLVGTFTIHNDNQALDLNVSGFSVAGTGWSSAQDPPVVVPPDSSQNFQVQLLSSVPLTPTTGTVSFQTSGADTTAFSFFVEGIVNNAPTTMDVEFQNGGEFLTANPGMTIHLNDDDDSVAFRIWNRGSSNELFASLQLNNSFFVVRETGTSQVDLFAGPGNLDGFQLDLVDSSAGQKRTKVTIHANDPDNSPWEFFVEKNIFDGGSVEIAQHPQDTWSPPGGTGQFQVVATGGSGSYTYQWQQIAIGGDFQNMSDGGDFSGVHTASLTVSNAEDSSFNVFKCVVSDAQASGNMAFSLTGSLIVSDPVAIDTQPETVVTQPGSTLTFNVTASGEQLRFQWQRRHSNGTWQDVSSLGDPAYSGADQPQLMISNVQAVHAVAHRCRVYQANAPQNEAFSHAAFVSFLEVTRHPKDVIVLGPATFSVEANGHGLPLSYRWHDEFGPIFDTSNRYSGAGTAVLSANIATVELPKNFYCLVSDGNESVASWQATYRNVALQLVAADAFSHGNVDREPLDDSNMTFGNWKWQADEGLVHYAGAALNDNGQVADYSAKFPYFPPSGSRVRLEVDVEFQAGVTDDSWVDLTLFSGASPHIWLRVRPGGVAEVFAAPEHLVASGPSSGSSSKWQFEVNLETGDVSAFRNYNPVATGQLPATFMADITKAGFGFHVATPLPPAGGQLRMNDYKLREFPHFQANDDVFSLDSSSAASLTMNVLANDFGNGLYLAQGIPMSAEHGTVVDNGDNTLTYTPDPGWTGWDQFYYGAGAVLGSGLAEVRVYTYQGFAIDPGDDEITVFVDQPREFSVTENDFHSQGQTLLLTDPGFPIPPKHGQVVDLGEGRIRYTPNSRFVGQDRFQYQVNDSMANQGQGWVTVRVVPPFKNLIGDDFDNQGAGRGAGAPLAGSASQYGGIPWRQWTPAGQTPHGFQFGENQLQFTSGGTNGPNSYTCLPLPRSFDWVLSPEFADGWETGNTNAWDNVQDTSGKISVIQNEPIAGSHSVALTAPGGDTTHARMIKVDQDPKSRARIRFIFEDKGMTGDPWRSFLMMRGFSTVGNSFFLHYEPGAQPRILFSGLTVDNTWVHDGWKPLDTSLERHLVELEWWGGTANDPLGGLRLWLDGVLVSEIENIENKGRTLKTVRLGMENLHSSIQGTMIYDDFQWESPQDVDLESTMTFGTLGSAGDQIWMGFADRMDRRADELGQTALYAIVTPKNVALYQSLRHTLGETDFLGSGSYDGTPGNPVKMVLRYHRQLEAASLFANGQTIFDKLPLDPEFAPRTLKAGFVSPVGSTIEQLSIQDVVVRPQGWEAVAFDDDGAFHQNDLPTLPLLPNDFGADIQVSDVTMPPQRGESVLNGDGTLTYRPGSVGTDVLQYSSTAGGQQAKAKLHLNIGPPLGPDPVAYVPFLRDGFEHNESAWSERIDNGGKMGYTSQDPLSGRYSLEFQIAGGETAPAYLKSHPLQGLSRLRVGFSMQARNLSLGSDRVYFFSAYSATQVVARLELRQVNGQLQIRARGRLDSGSWTVGGWRNLNTVEETGRVEFEWWSADSFHGDGGFRVWIDGILVDEVMGLANENIFLEDILLGLIGLDATTVGTLLFDDFQARRSLETFEFGDGFESGDSANWDATTNPNGLINFTPANPLSGNHSLSIDLPGGQNQQTYVQHDFSPETHYKAKFRFAVSNVSMENGDSHLVFRGQEGTALNLRMYYRHLPQPQIALQARRASGSWVSMGWRNLSPQVITTGQEITLEWWSDSVWESGDGFRLWLDGNLSGQLLNQGLEGQGMDRVKIGITGALETTTSGEFLFDDFQSWVQSQGSP